MRVSVHRQLSVVICHQENRQPLSHLFRFISNDLGPLLDGGIWRVVSDLRQVEASELTGEALRTAMRLVSGLVETSDPGGTKVFRLASLAVPGTMGQGIGRMMIGNLWGFPRMDFALFETTDAVGRWLGLPDGWEATAGLEPAHGVKACETR